MNYRHLLLLGAGLALLPGCSSKPPPREAHGTFSVKVVPYFGKNVQVYITAYETGNGRGKDIATYKVTGDGVTGFDLPMSGTYGVRAYADLDGDKTQGPAEPAASKEGLKPSADFSKPQEPIVLTLPGAGESPDWPHKKAAAPAGDFGPLKAEDVQKGIEKLHEAVPSLPIPPPPKP